MLNSLQRLEAAGHLVDLIATSIRMGHPRAHRMVGVTLGDLLHPSTDVFMLEATERLTSWIAAQPGVLTAKAEVAP